MIFSIDITQEFDPDYLHVNYDKRYINRYSKINYYLQKQVQTNKLKIQHFVGMYQSTWHWFLMGVGLQWFQINNKYSNVNLLFKKMIDYVAIKKQFGLKKFFFWITALTTRV